ncbi:uncharacterized membrane protein YcaP (DUF421 family) [Friedmanniella endophytica]|uniref:Uncharacterized membrane protein YcaP (DUF421 family) n=1 Tax=Microlunatus kandeliicorticis TaxID=1759536 RepID=A0A7W3IPQ2_9ACTN|nr:YetF domain-containing protein [Microlunatus kandeliicorticis]MBA8792905.1 uncharacterized membrane protein YcaP (DUF421 family) [Microlunatus kandeliicorticis]
MEHLIGQYQDLGWTAAKALLLLVVAVVGLRLAERRTLAELGIFDFAVAVAVGAIIGRTSTSSDTSFVTGAVALVTLLVAHRLISVLRRHGLLGRLIDRRPMAVVRDGQVQAAALARAGLTRNDLLALLRRGGTDELASLAVVLYESDGSLTAIRAGQQLGEPTRAGLREAGIGGSR